MSETAAKPVNGNTPQQPQQQPPPPGGQLPTPASIVKGERTPLPFEPHTVDDVWRLATMLKTSNLLPDALRERPENILLTIMTGRELGLSAMQSLRLICIVKGKPYIFAALKLALVKQSPTCVKFKCVESTAEIATFETDRKDEGVTRLSFTIEQARRAGLLSKQGRNGEPSNWDMYPEVMLRWRAISQLADMVYPDITQNVGAREELAADDLEDRGFLERVVPASVAPPAPPQSSPTPQAVDPGTGSPQSSGEAPAGQEVVRRMPIEDVPADPIDLEVAAIKKALAEAKTKKECLALTNRIMALPAVEKQAVAKFYEDRAKQLPAK